MSLPPRLLERPELRDDEEPEDDRTLLPRELLREGALLTLPLERFPDGRLLTLLPVERLPVERLLTLLRPELGRLCDGVRLGLLRTVRSGEPSVRLGGEYVRFEGV